MLILGRMPYEEIDILSRQVYWTGWIIVGEFYSQTSQNMIHVWKTLAFFSEIEMAEIEREKTPTIARFNRSLQTILGLGRLDCGINWRWDTVVYYSTL